MARPRKGEELGASSTIGVRVTAEMRTIIEALAEAHGRSLTDEVRALIEMGIAASARPATRRATR